MMNTARNDTRPVSNFHLEISKKTAARVGPHGGLPANIGCLDP